MAAELYDEFGNYVGPELDSASESSSGDEALGDGDAGDDDFEEDGAEDAATASRTQRLSGPGAKDAGARGGEGSAAGSAADDEADDGDAKMADAGAIVLHEDKKYYPDADEVYPDAEVLVQDEDTQGIEEPIIKPVEVKTFSKLDESAPNLRYSVAYLGSLMTQPRLIRNVAVAGHLHHGKSTLMDILIEETFETSKRSTLARKYARPSPRYCDARIDEQERKLSIKSCPVTMGLEDGRGKTFLVNAIDCPGHVNFLDETTAAMQAADGVLLVVDAVEGPLAGTKRVIALAARLGLPLSLCVSKIDRLVHELKLPPADAYIKLRNVIDRVNDLMAEDARLAQQEPFLPTAGNVCFASGADGYCFTLESWARLHLRHRRQTGRVDPAQFAQRLWGDLYFDPETRKFSSSIAPSATSRVRSFVHFVLEPLYKLYAQVLGEEPEVLNERLRALDVRLTDKELHLDPRPLLRLVMSRFFAGEATSGAADLFVRHVPAPGSPENQARLELACPGAPVGVKACDATAPLRAHVCKLYASPDGTSFRALAKVYSGTLHTGQRVRVLGESFSAADQEDMSVATVDALSICQARHRVLVDRVSAGNWVLIDGLGDHIVKAATLVPDNEPLDGLGASSAAISSSSSSSGGGSSGGGTFAALKFDDAAVVKLALEPVHPQDLPKMLHGLRCVNKSYPLLRTKVEESGEHVVFGTGEMYLDCVMQDLREMFAGIEIKVSDPMVSFCETVADTSAVKTHAETPNNRNKFTAIATPLEKGLGTAIEKGALRWDAGPAALGERLVREFDWDKLAARSLWAFGPTPQSPNVFLNDTLPGRVKPELLESVRESVVQGFCWASREGPLCDEPMRDVKFRMLGAAVAPEPAHRGAGFVIPTVRRVAYSAFLTAAPRLMEPIYSVEIQAPRDLAAAINRTLNLRRGRIFADAPIPGTPFSLFHGYLPVMDSFGFETDVRSHTQGAAFCHQSFDHWAVVPGDPMDDSVVLRPLESSREQELARDFMLKTRRRKGLPEDVAVAKYFDDPALLESFNRAMRVQDGSIDSDSSSSSGSDGDSDSGSSASSKS